MTYPHEISFWRIIYQSDKSYLLSLNGRNVTRWFPKSHSVIDHQKKVIRVTDWLWNEIKNNTGQVGL